MFSKKCFIQGVQIAHLDCSVKIWMTDKTGTTTKTNSHYHWNLNKNIFLTFNKKLFHYSIFFIKKHLLKCRIAYRAQRNICCSVIRNDTKHNKPFASKYICIKITVNYLLPITDDAFHLNDVRFFVCWWCFLSSNRL